MSERKILVTISADWNDADYVTSESLYPLEKLENVKKMAKWLTRNYWNSYELENVWEDEINAKFKAETWIGDVYINIPSWYEQSCHTLNGVTIRIVEDVEY